MYLESNVYYRNNQRIAKGYNDDGSKQFKKLLACRFDNPLFKLIIKYAKQEDISFAAAVRQLCWIGLIARIKE